jgi:hypothetical protein
MCVEWRTSAGWVNSLKNKVHINNINKIGKFYSLEYTDIPEVSFTAHHVGQCCTNVIQGYCCSTLWSNTGVTIINILFAVLSNSIFGSECRVICALECHRATGRHRTRRWLNGCSVVTPIVTTSTQDPEESEDKPRDAIWHDTGNSTLSVATSQFSTSFFFLQTNPTRPNLTQPNLIQPNATSSNLI